jgi:ABC-type uncharacterized transport system substrate-binding protein
MPHARGGESRPRDRLALKPPGSMEISGFFVAINRKTAKTLGINVPQSLVARADEVIE